MTVFIVLAAMFHLHYQRKKDESKDRPRVVLQRPSSAAGTSAALVHSPPSERDRHRLSKLKMQRKGSPLGMSESDTCFRAISTWRMTYAVLHKEILSGVRPKRFAVVILPDRGTADQLTGALTMSYYALFTNRALQFVSYGAMPHFDMAFDSPFINWTASYPEELYEHLKFTYKGVVGFLGKREQSPNRTSSAHTYWYLVNDDTGPDAFGHSNFRKIGPLNDSAPYAFLSSNRGRSYMIIHNRAHGPHLQRLGLHGQDLARCAFRFLFTPNTETLRKLNPFCLQWLTALR